MKLATTAAVAIAITAISNSSYAQPAPTSFDGIDTDRSGTLSREEIAKAAARVAGIADRQGRDAKAAKNPNAVFSSWDKDANGYITREEFDSRPRGGVSRRD